MNVLLHDSGLEEAATVRDRERLHGVWDFVTGRRKVQLLLRDNQFTARFSNGDMYVGAFNIDATKKPKAMDMSIVEGPDKHKGLVARCIYALDGDHLVWCPGEPGEQHRPGAFPATDSQGHMCIVFRRSVRNVTETRLER